MPSHLQTQFQSPCQTPVMANETICAWLGTAEAGDPGAVQSLEALSSGYLMVCIKIVLAGSVPLTFISSGTHHYCYTTDVSTTQPNLPLRNHTTSRSEQPFHPIHTCISSSYTHHCDTRTFAPQFLGQSPIRTPARHGCTSQHACI